MENINNFINEVKTFFVIKKKNKNIFVPKYHIYKDKAWKSQQINVYKNFNNVYLDEHIKCDLIKRLDKFINIDELLYKKIGMPVETDWPIQKQKVIFYSFDLLNQYKVTQVRPFLLALLDARGRKDANDKILIDESTFIQIILNLEKFHFIFSHLCQERASGLENIYTGSAKNIHAAGNDKLEVKKAIDELYKSLLIKMPDKLKIISALKKLKFTTNDENDKKTIQIIFKKIEQYLLKTTELNVGNFSLEHIEDQSTKALWIGNIGNIIPLNEVINNNLGSGLTFLQKKNKYIKSNLKIVSEFIKLNPQDEWDDSKGQIWADKLGELLIEATTLKSV